jgi:hypothetical protein
MQPDHLAAVFGLTPTDPVCPGTLLNGSVVSHNDTGDLGLDLWVGWTGRGRYLAWVGSQVL